VCHSKHFEQLRNVGMVNSVTGLYRPGYLF
jgi:hypothetical protein